MGVLTTLLGMGRAFAKNALGAFGHVAKEVVKSTLEALDGTALGKSVTSFLNAAATNMREAYTARRAEHDRLADEAQRLRQQEEELAAKFSRDGRATSADADDAKAIRAARDKLRERMTAVRAADTADEIMVKEDSISEHALNEHEVLAGVGLMGTKLCRRCGSVMRVGYYGARVDGKPRNFYWQCPRGYDHRESFNPLSADISVYRAPSDFLDASDKERRIITKDNGLLVKTHSRLRERMGNTDERLTCPIHLTKLVLLPVYKSQGDVRLCEYEYVCTGVDTRGVACEYKVPLDTTAAVDAALVRLDGRGIV